MAEVQIEPSPPQRSLDLLQYSGFGSDLSGNDITSHRCTPVEMEIPTPSNKVQDKEFINWIKLVLVLYYMKLGLQNFIIRSLAALHKSLREKICNGMDLSKLQQCTTCNEDVVRRNMANESSVQCESHCVYWVKELLAIHVKGSWNNVDWKKLRIPELQFKPWECAKVFISRQLRRPSASLQECDPHALLTLFLNCKHFGDKLSDQGKMLVHHIITIRNNVMHNSEMRISDSVLRDYTNEIIQLLQDPDSLKLEEDCNTAVRNIEKARQLSSLYPVKDKLQEMMQNVIKMIPGESIDTTSDTIQNVLDTLKHAVVDTIDTVSGTVKNVLKPPKTRSGATTLQERERHGCMHTA